MQYTGVYLEANRNPTPRNSFHISRDRKVFIGPNRESELTDAIHNVTYTGSLRLVSVNAAVAQGQNILIV